MDTTISENIREHLKKVKFILQSNTMTCCIILLHILWEAGITAIPYEYRDIDVNVDMVGRVLFYLIIPSLFIETYFAKSRLKCVCGYIIALIISGAVAPLGNLYYAFDDVFIGEVYRIEQIVGHSITPIRKCAAVSLCAVFLILSVMIMYKTIKDTKQRWDDYLISVFLNVAKTMIILIILFIYCTFVDSVMAEELLYHYYFDMFGQTDGTILVLETFYLGPVGLLVIGPYFGIKVILTFKDMGEKPGKFLHSLGRDVLHTIILCVTGYAYFYMLVVLLVEELYVSTVISVLFAVWLSVVILAGDGEGKTVYGKVISILTALMIPLTSVQGCDMAVRIYRHGMRPEWYVGMILFIFEISAMFVYYFRKEQYGKLLPFFGLLAVITFYVPFINRNSVSNLWQMSLLKKYYQAVYEGEVTSKFAYDRLKNSYDYLSYSPKMQKAIEPYNIYEEDFAGKLKEQYAEADLTHYNHHLIYYFHMADEVDTSGYSQVSTLIQNRCYDKDGEDGIDVDFSCFQFEDSESGEIITADISGFIEKCKAYIEEFPDASDIERSDVMKAYNRIELDNDTVLYINRINIWYYDGLKIVEPCFVWDHIDIDGILLQK